MKKRRARRGVVTALSVLRRSRGFNQTELGDACKRPLQQTIVSQIENRILNPTEEQINDIAEVLQYPYAPPSLLLSQEKWAEQFGEMMKLGEDDLVGIEEEFILPQKKGK